MRKLKIASLDLATIDLLHTDQLVRQGLETLYTETATHPMSLSYFNHNTKILYRHHLGNDILIVAFKVKGESLKLLTKGQLPYNLR